MGEACEDGGGPRREFWALLSKEIKSSMLEGCGNKCVLRHDVIGLQVGFILVIECTCMIYVYL